jgi:hypothetical protein
MTTYVRAQSGGQYHWCKNCDDYPKYIGTTTTTRPEGYLCDQCRDKQEKGNCDLR